LSERAVPGSRTEVRPDAKPPAAATAKADSKPAPKPEPKPVAKDEAGKGPDVLARLIDRANNAGGGAEVRDGSAAKSTRKFLVQIGAFSNVQSARNVSDRAVQAGLRPYQETVKTAHGDWIRVRVGPFTTRQDAERAQQDLKRAGVTAAIIAL
jgi:DedD protein